MRVDFEADVILILSSCIDERNDSARHSGQPGQGLFGITKLIIFFGQEGHDNWRSEMKLRDLFLTSISRLANIEAAVISPGITTKVEFCQ